MDVIQMGAEICVSGRTAVVSGVKKLYGAHAAATDLRGGAALVIAGLAGLVVGGQMFVDNATSLAKALGVSDKIIAITLLAGGTSLPELATCVVAAAKHKDALALGNILGSNVFNILLILGASAVVTPLSTAAMNLADFGVVLFSAVLLWIFTYTGKRNKIDRWEGAILLACEICYMVYLFIKG